MSVNLRLLRSEDLDAAERLYRQSFRSFLAIPERLLPDSDYIRTRFHANPEGAWGAELNGELIGLNLVSPWGSFAVLGPTAVKPQGWTGGAGRLLMERGVQQADALGCRIQGGFTFANSMRHVEFFQALGFWPRYLTFIHQGRVEARALPPNATLHSKSGEEERTRLVHAARDFTGTLLEGLELTREITAIHRHGYGDIVYLTEGSAVVGLALCHVGLGTEAGSDTCYVKFGAVAPGVGGPERLTALLDACEHLASERKVTKLAAGVNSEREQAAKLLRSRGMPVTFQGISLHRPNTQGYNRPDALIIDDWR